MTIFDVLVRLKERAGTNGTESGNVYAATTFTWLPGALQVPVVHVDQVVGCVELAVIQVVVTVSPLDRMPG
jgi:hypothetical protein